MLNVLHETIRNDVALLFTGDYNRKERKLPLLAAGMWNGHPLN